MVPRCKNIRPLIKFRLIQYSPATQSAILSFALEVAGKFDAVVSAIKEHRVQVIPASKEGVICMVFWVMFVFMIAFDVFWLYLMYKDEISRKKIVLIPPSWFNTKKIQIYFFLFSLFSLLNIPFFGLTYLRYADDPYMLELMFLISIVYVFFALVVKNIILRLITKNFRINNKKFSDYFVSINSKKDEGFYDDVVNLQLPNGKRYMASFKFKDNEISFWRVSLFALWLKLFHFRTRQTLDEKTKLASFYHSQIKLVEKTRYLLRNHAFHILLTNNDDYCINFQQPKEALIKLRILLPQVEYIGFEDWK